MCYFCDVLSRKKRNMEIKIEDAALRQAAASGMDEFIETVRGAILDAIGGQLTAQNMGELNAEQITLLAWGFLHEEMMDGGMVQLIYNGYGPFFFLNPTARAFREWGLGDLYRLLNRGHKFYNRHRQLLESDCDDEAFMALYEQCPEFDDLDDEFVENEEEWTGIVARYVDEHLGNFVAIVNSQD